MRRFRVQVRESIDARRDELETGFVAAGAEVLAPEARGRRGDLVVWALDRASGVDDLRASPTAGRVLALVEDDGPGAVADMLAAGARGVLARGSDAAVVVSAGVVVTGGYVVTPDTGRTAIAGGLDGQDLRRMRAIARGAQVADVAIAEGCSERELYRRLRRAYARLGVSTRTEALVALARADLLS